MIQQDTKDEERLIGYLLGRVDPDEQARIEERSLTDPDFHDELQAAERELIDQYVHGELSNPEVFEEHFLSSPRRRQKVEFARALMQSFARAPVVVERSLPSARRDSTWASVLRWLNIHTRAWQVATATLALVAAGWLVLIWQNQNDPDQVAQMPPPVRTALPAPPGPAISAPEETQPSRPTETPPPIRLAMFILTPSLTRAGDEPQTLTIEGNVEVRLQLHLEAGGYETYRAVLRTAEGDEIWRQDQLKPARTTAGPAVVVSLPASRFSSGDYTIRLGGATAGGEVEDVSGYYFRVQKK